jgi:hypothetical protein
VAVADPPVDTGAEVGAVGARVVPPGGVAGVEAVADCEAAACDADALALAEVAARADGCPAGEGAPLCVVVPGAEAGADRGVAADGLTPPPLAPASWTATVGVPEPSTIAPAPPAASSPAVVSASTRVRDRCLRARRRWSRLPEARRGGPGGAVGLP